jgi:hypothetical protein
MEKTEESAAQSRCWFSISYIYTHTTCANLDTILTSGDDVLPEIIQQLKAMERVILFSHNQK